MLPLSLATHNLFVMAFSLFIYFSFFNIDTFSDDILLIIIDSKLQIHYSANSTKI